MKLKFCKLPLELRLIIYEYFDPKNRRVVIDDFEFINKRFYAHIEYEKDEKIIFLKYAIYFGEHETDFKIINKTVQHFYLRQSQVINCYKRLKQIK